ncbi:MAG: CHASE domain-containing protein [Variovorax sp.]
MTIRPLVWLCVGLGAAAAAGLWQASQNETRSARRFALLATRAVEQVELRMRSFEYGARGARGAIIAAGGANAISRATFAQYSASRDIEAEFPGALGFGFIRRVPIEEEANFVAAVRRDGQADFAIRGLGPNEGERFVIQMIGPDEGNNHLAIGLDIASETNRRLAAEQAMRTGRVTLTAPIKLSRTDSHAQRSFLLLLPVRRNDPSIAAGSGRYQLPETVLDGQQRTVGWIYAPLVIDRVLADLSLGEGELALRLSDVTQADQPIQFFDSTAEVPHANARRTSLQLELFGRQWRADLIEQPMFLARLDLLSPWDVAGAVGTLTFLFTLLSYSQVQTRRRKEQADQQRLRLAAVVDSSVDAIIGHDPVGTITDWNHAAEVILGYSAGEAIGQKIYELLVPPKYADAARARIPKLAQGEILPAFETWVQRRDGTRIPVSATAVPIFAPDGRVVSAAATLRDISAEVAARTKTLEQNASLEQQVAERTIEVRNSERFMRIVTDNIPGVVAYWGRDLRCTFANSAHKKWADRTAAEMIGTTQEELLGSTQWAKNEPHFLAALAGQSRRVERTRRLADGLVAHYWLHYIPDRDEDGAVNGVITVAVDVTDMKQAQTQLEALNLTLNERSAQAESASRAKSEFLANMSHEIRSPLNVVIGLAYLMRQTPLDQRQQSFLEKIDGASNALLGVVNDILDISKIEAGQMAMEESEFELPALLDEVMAMMAVASASKKIALDLNVQPDLPSRFVGDVTRIRQVLVNLVSNAIKFTAKGSVRLVVRMPDRSPEVANAPLETSATGAPVPQAPDLVRLRFEVQDTGPGIEADVLGRLFTPFTQADMSTTRRFGGTGLGLSIVKQLSELMHGAHGVQTKVGRGSTFWFELPLRSVRHDAWAAHSRSLIEAARTQRGSGPHLAGLRVLVADDSAVNLEVCQHILERHGARVSLASDGQQAVEALRAEPHGFDAVLMDIHMPVLDGNEATQRIRNELGLTKLPIIALTASALVAERNRALQCGMTDFVSKPFNAHALMRCLRRHTDAARGDDATDLAKTNTARSVESAATILPAHWPRIDGIDAADAFKRLDGDVDLMRSVLQRLLSEFADFRPGSTASPQAGAELLAKRLHKLRGSASMIGATATAELATEAEAALQDGAWVRAEQALHTLGATLRKLKQAAQSFIDHAAEPAAVDKPPALPDPEQLMALVAALQSQSLGAVDLFRALAPGLLGAMGSDGFMVLERAVTDLQFRRAAEILQDVALA